MHKGRLAAHDEIVRVSGYHLAVVGKLCAGIPFSKLDRLQEGHENAHGPAEHAEHGHAEHGHGEEEPVCL